MRKKLTTITAMLTNTKTRTTAIIKQKYYVYTSAITIITITMIITIISNIEY